MLYSILKRCMDLVLSSFLLLLFSPLLILTSIAIKLESSGPVFYTPTRIGKGGKHFKMFKFRSMKMYRIDGQFVHAHEVLKKDEHLLSEYKKNSYKLINDPRVTRVGRFIRRFSIDEMPQFLNVLKGEMSIIGPRAYLPNELVEQQKVYPETKKYVKSLLLVKPGITGFWQVSGRSEINFDKRIQMDAEYAERRSIVYDILILIKTPYAMIVGRGAV